MSRIRSVHPGLFTDEGFMGLSAVARVLLIGLWVEADDQGVFEWKPLTLKARLLPADVVDVSALLGELVAARFVRQFEHDGKSYGAVRNFRRYQRPKKPNATYHLPPEWRTFVGLSANSTEEVPHQFPTEGEKSPQMEDGGGRREEGESVVPAAVAPALPLDEADLQDIPDFLDKRKGSRLPEDWTLPDEWEQWARQRRPEVDCRLEAEKFANFWWSKSGKDGTKRDWFATWRNWILNANAKGNGHGKRDQQDSVIGGYASIIARHEAGA